MATLLAAVSGWSDAITFQWLGQVFVSVVTGNFVIVGLALSDRDSERLVLVAIVVAANAGGVLLASTMVRRGTGTTLPEGTQRILATQVVLFATAGILWRVIGDPSQQLFPGVVVVVFLTFGLGMQAALVAAFAVTAVKVNYVTGLFTTLVGLAAARVGHAQRPASGVTGVVLGAILVSYVVAAFAVGIISRPAPALVIPPIAAIVVVAGLAWRHERLQR